MPQISQVNYSGKISDLSGDLKVDIRDIARGLANSSKFNGQTQVPYSIAQHSVLVSYLCPSGFSFAGLMHDAHKAYFGEITGPVKNLFDQYAPNVIRATEWRIAAQVRRYFGLCPEFNECIKVADERADQIERARLFSSDAVESLMSIGMSVEYSDKIGEIWSSHEAYTQFMIRFKEVSPFS